jgi:hypothetical protein
MAVAVAYELRKSTRYWYGQGDHRYTLSSDLWAWQRYPVPQRGDLPPLVLSADENAAIDKAAQERRRMTRELDRAMALEKWGPRPERPQQKRRPRKRHARLGRPPDYQVEIIRQIARDYIEVYGRPATQAMFREKVRSECEGNGFKVPGETRLKQLIDPIYKRNSPKKSQSH